MGPWVIWRQAAFLEEFGHSFQAGGCLIASGLTNVVTYTIDDLGTDIVSVGNVARNEIWQARAGDHLL